MLSERQETILNVLQRDRRATSYTLASIIDAPEASVRRDIQAIRRAGHRVSYATDMHEYELFN